MISKKIILTLTFLLLIFTLSCSNELSNKPYSSIETIEDIESISLSEEVPSNIPTSDHAFIILGFALSEEGEMRDALLNRLEVALDAGNKNKNSKFIVTGGVPKNGITEADVMFDWLKDQGIEENRIIKENQSKNTVENALYSMKIVDHEEIESVTIITSASHMRRALMLFIEADKADVLSSHLVYMDYESPSKHFDAGEKMLIEHDLKRIIELMNNNEKLD